MTNTRTRARRNRNNSSARNSRRNPRRNQLDSNTKLYSLGMVENNGVYKIVDTLMYQPVNQFKAVWKKVDSRNVSRALNRGTLVIK